MFKVFITLGIIMVSFSNVMADDTEQNAHNRYSKVDLASPNWQVINDNVMGGLSVGKTKISDKNFLFSGSVSIENNGGFTSVYQPVSNMVNGLKSIRIKVKGDGREYQLRARTKLSGYDLAYKANFSTLEGVTQNLEFSLTEFQASFRGRIITNAPVLKSEQITHVGFLITSKQSSEFSLSVFDITYF